MLILYAIYLAPVLSSVRSFPTTERLSGCTDMPSSYKYSAAKDDISIHVNDIINDISSFVANFSKRFSEMKMFIDEHKNKTKYLDVKYYLFTPLNPRTPHSLNDTEESMSNSYFNPYLPTTVIVHGYSRTLDINNSTFSIMKDYLLKRSPHNVIIMDYTKYCRGPYTEAVKNSYLIAMNLASFTQLIAENSFAPLMQFHFIGISLGAQISGNAGTLIPGLGRITGLDPAGPLFDMFPSNYRLNYEDAFFVDVIHTGATSFPNGLGIPKPTGHLDFYPNGGSSQPGCNASQISTNSIIGEETINAVRCSHSRAVFLFLESFCNDECQFVGINCDSYKNFQNGDCTFWNSASAVMGINAEWHENLPPETKFYLDTDFKLPYCRIEINT